MAGETKFMQTKKNTEKSIRHINLLQSNRKEYIKAELSDMKTKNKGVFYRTYKMFVENQGKKPAKIKAGNNLQDEFMNSQNSSWTK